MVSFVRVKRARPKCLWHNEYTGPTSHDDPKGDVVTSTCWGRSYAKVSSTQGVHLSPSHEDPKRKCSSWRMLNGKMSIDYFDLNKACPKRLIPFTKHRSTRRWCISLSISQLPRLILQLQPN
ncbi:hypothetical protein CR513_36594, partial [Mucuna pruriens]